MTAATVKCPTVFEAGALRVVAMTFSIQAPRGTSMPSAVAGSRP